MMPTARTLAYCRKLGWSAGVVERWVPQARRRVDLFGFIDLIALDDDGPGVLAIQATSTSNMASRVTKATVERGENLQRWLQSGNRFEVWGWAKRGAAGKRKLWTLRRVAVRYFASEWITEVVS